MIAPWLDDGDVQLYHDDAEVVLATLPDRSAQCVVTSPPYWGLRDYGQPEQLGLEETPADYVDRLVCVFAQVRRVLRDDGTVWLNLGDSYAGNGTTGRKESISTGLEWPGTALRQPPQPISRLGAGLKPKDLVGIPWRVAFALQADGWYLRSDVIWSKPNPMPESVTDRPTKAHEYLFLLSKQPRYYYDQEAIREPAIHAGVTVKYGPNAKIHDQGDSVNDRRTANGFARGITVAAGRNRRSVWEIATQPFPEAHFATFPEALVRPCILAGTSERGECSACGAPWTREVDIERTERVSGGPSPAHTTVKGYSASSAMVTNALPTYTTTGWRASCQCDAPTRPQTVLDPFIGSGTTAHVARKHGRRCIGIDLSSEYLEIAARRLSQLSLLAEAGE